MKILIAVLIAVLSAAVGCQPSGEGLWQQQLEKARQAVRQGAYEQAISALDVIADPSWQSREIDLIRGLASFKLRDFHHAMEAFEKADPASPVLRSYMGYLHLFLHEMEAAATQAEVIRTAHGETPEFALLRGNIKLREQAFADARAMFHQVASSVDQASHGYMGLANAALLENDLATAEQYYLSALLASPHEIRHNIVLARFYMMAQRDDEAEAYLSIALQKQPGHTNAIILLGNLLIKQNRCAEALGLYLQYKDLIGSSVLSLQTLRCMLREQQYEPVAESLAAFESKSSRSYLKLAGEFNLRTGDIQAALTDFYGVSAAETDFIIDYYLGVISILREEPDLALAYFNKSRKKNAAYSNTYLLTAIVYVLKHDYAEASKYATWAANLEPSSIEAHTVQGLASYFQGQYAEAAYAFDLVTEFAPEHPIPYFFKALMAMRQEMAGARGAERELFAYINAAYIERIFLEAGLGQGAWHRDADQVRAFMTAFTAYLKAHPSLLGALVAADYFQRAGQVDQAERYVKAALALREDCALCYYKLAYLANLRHQAEAATAYLQRALEMNANLLPAYQALGGLYEQQGDYTRALQLYKRALTMAPDDVVLLNNVGWLTLVELDDPGNAYVYLRKAASIAPNDPNVRDSLAWWYYRNRDIERAVALLTPLADEYPTHPLYQYHMGMAHIASGQTTVGQKHLRLALRHGLDGEAANRAREGLQ